MKHQRRPLDPGVCGGCHGFGVTRWKVNRAEPHQPICGRCHGTGRVAVDTAPRPRVQRYRAPSPIVSREAA